MGARGKQSKDAIAVVIKAEFGRALPPDDLPDVEKEIWRRTVASEAIDLFATAATRDCLAKYCEDMAGADRFMAEMRKFTSKRLTTDKGIREYGLLARQRDLHLARAHISARSLRLTNQSRYRADAAGARSKKQHTMPWEDEAKEA